MDRHLELCVNEQIYKQVIVLTYNNSSTCVSITIVCSDGEVKVFVGRYGNSDGGGMSI